jgi:hypothetical protein
MQKNIVQLDIFEAQTDNGLPSTTAAPLVEEPEPTDAMLEGDEPHCLCFFPSAGIQECRDCWERHPEQWARYITRANCVRHTR